MNLIDKITKAYAEGKMMPLKGHTKIILTDTNTGKQTVVEKDNLVTNAVAGILAKNWCGLAQFNSILPLKNLFSGVICFDNDLTESADNFNPPDATVADQICHAGNEAHTTGDRTRGNPNIGEQVVTDTSIKFVWDFSTNFAGEIHTVCLVPGLFGNMGLKPFDTTYNPIYSFGDNREIDTSWSTTRAKRYPFTIANDGKTCKSVYASGTTFTEYTMRHDFFTFGIMRGPKDWQDVGAPRTATLSASFDDRKSFIFDDASYYYVAKASSSSIAIDKISKSDMTVTSSTYSPDGVTLYIGNLGTASFHPNAFMRVFAFDGTYLYYPNAGMTKFIKMNLSNAADVTELTETITINDASVSGSDGDQFMSPIVINEGLILGDNYVLNGTHEYNIRQTRQVGGNAGYSAYTRYLDAIKMGSACYGNAVSFYETGSAGQSAILNTMVLSTINLLDSPVQKLASMTMQIQYTITET